jgi:hypothetical protein
VAQVLALVPDLMLASRVEATLGAVGHRVRTEIAAEAADLEGVDLVVLDVGAVDSSKVAGRGPPVLGFYSHTDVETRKRAEAAGVDLVVPRSRLAREMPELVERLLAERR